MNARGTKKTSVSIRLHAAFLEELTSKVLMGRVEVSTLKTARSNS